MCSSRVANIGRSEPFLYLIMSPGDRCPLLSSLVVADGSGEVLGSGAEVGSSVDFFLGYTSFLVVSKDGVFLGEPPCLSYFLLESSRFIRGFMTLYS